MSVEIPLKTKYVKVQNGKMQTRAAGGGNSARKHPGRQQGSTGLRAEGELKKKAMAQTEANRRILVIDPKGRKHWLLLSVYKKIQNLEEYLDA